jgi:hypothetical protein
MLREIVKIFQNGHFFKRTGALDVNAASILAAGDIVA